MSRTVDELKTWLILVKELENLPPRDPPDDPQTSSSCHLGSVTAFGKILSVSSMCTDALGSETDGAVRCVARIFVSRRTQDDTNAAEERFANFHGLPCARLDQEQSVYKDPNESKSSYFVKLISPVLFFAPAVYLESLRTAYVDRRVLMRVWQPLIQKLNSEWQEFILVVRFSFAYCYSYLTTEQSGHGCPERRCIVPVNK